LEFEKSLAALAQSEHAALVQEYKTVHQAFEEAEVQCEQIRRPYEEAIQAAQRNYETKRQEYLRMVEEVREQLDKAPDENRQRFDEILSKYNRVCAEERERVIAAGGLHILGTERHESRRIDNQLRGRSGRQGDPGSSHFVLSLEDDLMRIFAGDKVRSMMEWLGMEKGVAIESKTVSRQIERAQKAVEARNVETRKHVLKYDDVMNRQRETIYGLRRQLMFQPEHREFLLGETGVAKDLLHDLTFSFLNPETPAKDW